MRDLPGGPSEFAALNRYRLAHDVVAVLSPMVLVAAIAFDLPWSVALGVAVVWSIAGCWLHCRGVRVLEQLGVRLPKLMGNTTRVCLGIAAVYLPMMVGGYLSAGYFDPFAFVPLVGLSIFILMGLVLPIVTFLYGLDQIAASAEQQRRWPDWVRLSSPAVALSLGLVVLCGGTSLFLYSSGGESSWLTPPTQLAVLAFFFTGVVFVVSWLLSAVCGAKMLSGLA